MVDYAVASLYGYRYLSPSILLLSFLHNEPLHRTSTFLLLFFLLPFLHNEPLRRTLAVVPNAFVMTNEKSLFDGRNEIIFSALYTSRALRAEHRFPRYLELVRYFLSSPIRNCNVPFPSWQLSNTIAYEKIQLFFYIMLSLFGNEISRTI